MKALTPLTSSGQALSETKGLVDTNKRFFAEFILERSERLRMTFCVSRKFLTIPFIDGEGLRKNSCMLVNT